MDSLLCVRRCIKHFTHFIVYNAPASLWVAIGIPTVAEKVEPEKLPRITHLLSSGTAQVADHLQWHTVDLCVVYMPAHRPLPDRSNPIHCSDHPLEHRISCALVICFKPGLPKFVRQGLITYFLRAPLHHKAQNQACQPPTLGHLEDFISLLLPPR